MRVEKKILFLAFFSSQKKIVEIHMYKVQLWISVQKKAQKWKDEKNFV